MRCFHGSRWWIRALTISGEAVPEGHELRLHISHGFMVCCASLPQETINLIDEDNSRLELVSKAKHSRNCHNNNMPTSAHHIPSGKKIKQQNWHLGRVWMKADTCPAKIRSLTLGRGRRPNFGLPQGHAAGSVQFSVNVRPIPEWPCFGLTTGGRHPNTHPYS